MLYANAGDRDDLFKHLQKNKRLENYELVLRTRTGKPLHVISNIMGIFNEKNEMTQVKGYLYDITAHKKIEEQFWMAQKMEAIGRLAGGVAHDFNNLLVVIIGYTDLLMKQLEINNPLRKNLDVIKKAGISAEKLISQLLAFSRRQIMRPEVMDLNKLIVNLEKMLRRLIGEDIRLITKLTTDLRKIEADPGQIEQVLMNLCVNARDAMQKGGNLTINTENISFQEDNTQERVVMLAGNYVLLTVSDTGIGMDEQTKANIFEPFFTTKEKGKGTGLGLSTVYGIIKQSGGYIWVDSQSNKGTTFKIYLKPTEKIVESISKSKEIPASFEGTETILLVEDDDAVLNLSENVLKNYGYQVLNAKTGEQAQMISLQHKTPIQLLVTDVVLPGMGGRELANLLKRYHPEMEVLYVSGYPDEAIFHHGVLNDDVNFLQKPFSPEELAQKVREALDAKIYREKYMNRE
jgi:two-component system cell cycle sensor histidine kinase/response regulator CckA